MRGGTPLERLAMVLVASALALALIGGSGSVLRIGSAVLLAAAIGVYVAGKRSR